jgi:hypothetical protein
LPKHKVNGRPPLYDAKEIDLFIRQYGKNNYVSLSQFAEMANCSTTKLRKILKHPAVPKAKGRGLKGHYQHALCFDNQQVREFIKKYPSVYTLN